MTTPAPAASVDPLESMRTILAAVEAAGDHFAILGLTATASASDIRDAYFRLAKVVHPDLPLFMAKPQLKLDATRAFQAITAAHTTLSNPARRNLYLQQQQQAAQAAQQAANATAQATAEAAGLPEGTIGLEPPANPEVARIYLHRGRQQLTRRDWPGAQEALELAAKALKDREQNEARLLLGWSIFNNQANPENDRLARSKALWTEVTEAKQVNQPHVAQAHYYLAIWNKLNGEMKLVTTNLARCLQLDPRHIEAAREHRLLERRRTTGNVPEMEARNAAAINGQTRPSKTSPAAGGGKVKIERKPTFFERLFGKR